MCIRDRCDTQFLFSDDILGDYDDRLPRHAKAYRNFLEEHRRLQRERIAAFSEFIADVKGSRFPEPGNLIEMDDAVLQRVIASVSSVTKERYGILTIGSLAPRSGRVVALVCVDSGP